MLGNLRDMKEEEEKAKGLKDIFKIKIIKTVTLPQYKNVSNNRWHASEKVKFMTLTQE